MSGNALVGGSDAAKALERPEHEAFAQSLAEGVTMVAAAKRAGVDLTTAYRWARRPEIGLRVVWLSQQQLQVAAGAASRTVEKLSRSARAESVRLRAAVEVLDRVGFSAQGGGGSVAAVQVVIDYGDRD